jgi:hypothetical protein
MPFDAKFWITAGALFVVSMLLGFVVHAVLLAPDYEALTSIMRSPAEQEARFGFMLGAHVLMAFGLAWLYRTGHSADRPWLGQGVRFGIAYSLAAAIPIYLIYYVVAQFPLELAIKQSLLETASLVVLGVTAAYINQ